MTDLRTTNFSTLPPIIAVDFDGTLVVDNFPNIGKEIYSVCNFIRNAQNFGVKTILWTSRTGKALEDAIEWCENNDLHFTTVNENIPEVIELTGGSDTRKVYANVYIDDRNRTITDLPKTHMREIVAWLEK